MFGAAGDPKLFDPAFASDGETFRVLKQIFDGLVKTKEGSADDRAGAGHQVGEQRRTARTGPSPSGRA